LAVSGPFLKIRLKCFEKCLSLSLLAKRSWPDYSPGWSFTVISHTKMNGDVIRKQTYPVAEQMFQPLSRSFHRGHLSELDSWQVFSLCITGLKLPSYLRANKQTEVVSAVLWAGIYLISSNGVVMPSSARCSACYYIVKY